MADILVFLSFFSALATTLLLVALLAVFLSFLNLFKLKAPSPLAAWWQKLKTQFAPRQK